MTIVEHLQELYDLPAFTFPLPDEGEKVTLPEPDAVAWALRGDAYGEGEEEWEEVFARFLETVDTTRVRALIVGAWSEAYDTDSSAIVAALLAARERLPELKALFVGDLTMEEAEISWITQSDLTGLLRGFPALEEFGVRGGSGLALSAVRHGRLRSLTIETGGLGVEVVRGVAESELPALERLDLWLGTGEYGADAEVSDLAPFLTGERLPSLRHLALRNSSIQDDIAIALATAPVVARLEVLDLSMGTLGDRGAEALLSGQSLTHLQTLDLDHHYIGEELQRRLRETLGPAGVQVLLDPDGAEEYDDGDGEPSRYVAISE
ncbi:STM4015 family protein [Streptomyces sp. NPDC057638]|uniref:STM4015 family protein n=1 Tax=Streptomyces sp. NPDC057638 TaxID=3346190 RepID=UPI0036B0BF90